MYSFTPDTTIESAKINANFEGLADGSQIDNGAITPNKLVDGAGSSWAWQSWTPTLTGITQGSGGVIVAKYTQIGKTVHFFFKFTFGTGSAITTGVVSTPVTASANFYTSFAANIGVARYVDNDTSSNNSGGICRLESTTTIRPVVYTVSTYLREAGTSASIPFTWASNDVLMMTGTYEAA